MAEKDPTTGRPGTTINVRGCSCSVEANPDGHGFTWRTQPENGHPVSGKADTADEAWGEAVEWASAVAKMKSRDHATWDKAVACELEASPEMKAELALHHKLNRAWVGVKGLDGVLSVLQANSRHEELFADDPENGGRPLNPYVVGGLQDAAAFLANAVRESIEDAAKWKPFRA